MKIFTIGYAKKSAREFFELLRAERIEVLIDIRLYNSSQLAGFTKSRDLQYFVERICGCDYIWASDFAPIAKLLNDYKYRTIGWSEYESGYTELLRVRDNLSFFEKFIGKRICLLCAEETSQCCHRRLFAKKISAIYENAPVKHL